ncbi:hypothetical protein DFH06DRAFT_1345554 [Mycena polygramma]|nr:hypothetical protein DFH06DRAFT_1345554 [Mycena polygramma]
MPYAPFAPRSPLTRRPKQLVPGGNGARNLDYDLLELHLPNSCYPVQGSSATKSSLKDSIQLRRACSNNSDWERWKTWGGLELVAWPTAGGLKAKMSRYYSYDLACASGIIDNSAPTFRTSQSMHCAPVLHRLRAAWETNVRSSWLRRTRMRPSYPEAARSIHHLTRAGVRDACATDPTVAKSVQAGGDAARTRMRAPLDLRVRVGKGGQVGLASTRSSARSTLMLDSRPSLTTPDKAFKLNTSMSRSLPPSRLDSSSAARHASQRRGCCEKGQPDGVLAYECLFRMVPPGN